MPLLFVGLLHSNADKNVIYNFRYLHDIEMNSQTIWITILEMLRKNREFA
jgi:hypothetical protein